MLQKLREKTTGWVAVVIVAALAIPFAFVGIENYRRPNLDFVAKVGEIEISRDDFQRRLEGYVEQARQMMGESFERRLVDTPEARRQLLDRMIDEALFRQAADDLGMVVPASEIRDEIMAIPAFQVAGEFNAEQYQQLLAMQRLSPRGFEQLLLQDLQSRALPQSVVSSAFLSDAQVDTFLRLRDQKRSFSYIEMPTTEVDAEVTEEALQAFYEGNLERYRSEESVRIQYLTVGPEQVAPVAEPSEDTLRQRYEEAGRRFVEPEQRLASHILIRVPANADAEAERAALEQAEQAANRAREADADFAALASELSQDPGSSNTGGDLGWLERGFTDPAFEDALFAMEAGVISEPVKSSEGWHVIQLREIRDEVGKPFEDVRAELLAEYLSAERERALSDLGGRLVDLILRDPTSLDTTAAELGVELQTAGPMTRQGGSEPLLSNPRVIEAAFSTPVLEDDLVSDAIELDGGVRMALRVVERTPSDVQPLDSVRAQVQADFDLQRREDAARAEAAALLAALESGESTLETIAEARELELKDAPETGRNAFTVNPVLLREVFRLAPPEADAPKLAKIDLGGIRFALVSLSSVIDGDPSLVPQAERDALRSQLAEATGDAEARALGAALRQRLPVQFSEERL
ncbi:MAG: SurA N-terminal domain-containing protein [Aquimonas sp.]|nr:SurA N-terminal domain-containing protein [Aquimonas sp.]